MGKNIELNKLELGEKVLGFFLIKRVEVRKTKGTPPKDYLDMDISNKNGEINCRMWNTEDIEKANKSSKSEDSGKIKSFRDLKQGDIVKIEGKITQHNDRLQITVDKIRTSVEEDKVDKIDYIQTAPISIDEMREEINSYIKSIENEQIRKVVIEIVKEYRDKLIYYPAAKKNHHSMHGGLLYHTLRMLQSADGLCKVYNGVNRDLVISGVILHDMCKIDEMISDEYGIVSDYTVEGSLVGHLVLGSMKVREKCKELNVDNEISIQLQHIILSHHGELEWGSPKKPTTIEAQLVHLLDIMDSRIFDFEKATSNIEEGKFSEKVYTLGGIKVYNPKK